jgi:hypothetical protein
MENFWTTKQAWQYNALKSWMISEEVFAPDVGA